MIDDIKKVNPSGNHKKNSLHLYELFPVMSSFFTFDTTSNMIRKECLKCLPTLVTYFSETLLEFMKPPSKKGRLWQPYKPDWKIF